MMSDNLDPNFIADMEEISREIAQHQIETFGRELTQEEHEQVYVELFEESQRKYAGKTIEEVARIQTEDLEKWEKEMVERYGPGFFEGFKYLEDGEDDNNFTDEKGAVNA